MKTLEKAKAIAKKSWLNIRADSWTNPFTGLGTIERDKMKSNTFKAGGRMEAEYADMLYAEDDIAARVCDTMPEYSFLKGFEVRVSPDTDTDETDDMEALIAGYKEIEQDMADFMEDIGVVSKFKDAAVWANVFGGCAILIGDLDGARAEQLAEPLNENAPLSVRFLNVVDRRYLEPAEWYKDPSEPKLGEPSVYLFTPEVVADSSGANLRIHESRLLIFKGIRTSSRRKQNNNGWDDSLLQRMDTVLTQFGVSWDSLAHIISDANQGVFKMTGLVDALAADKANVVQNRMQLVDMSRSVVRAVVLDADGEEFERQNFSWAGIGEPFYLLMYRLSAAVRIPVSVLFGRSPAGMNSTGEHDTGNFYDQVEAYREEHFIKNLRRLVSLIFRAKDGPTAGDEPKNWRIEFPSLWSKTPKEEAEIYKAYAEGDKANVESGVLAPEEIALSRYGPNGFSTEISIDMNARMVEDEEPEPESGPEPIPPVPPVILAQPETAETETPDLEPGE